MDKNICFKPQFIKYRPKSFFERTIEESKNNFAKVELTKELVLEHFISKKSNFSSTFGSWTSALTSSFGRSGRETHSLTDARNQSFEHPFRCSDEPSSMIIVDHDSCPQTSSNSEPDLGGGRGALLKHLSAPAHRRHVQNRGQRH